MGLHSVFWGGVEYYTIHLKATREVLAIPHEEKKQFPHRHHDALEAGKGNGFTSEAGKANGLTSEAGKGNNF